MTIQCYMPVYNEADILPHILVHMERQGVQVHVIDGWSDDGSYDITRQYATVERLPADGPSGIWGCRELLARVEDLAAQSTADWCGLSDADEWRRSPRVGETFSEGIARWDAEGCNCIDHDVFSFYCIDDGWTPELDPDLYFRHYDQADMICRLPQQKFWKNTGQRVNLTETGGHAANFPGKRVAPEKFLMKHYPYRTPEQARRKIETRIARRCQAEHRDGWGVHYDAFPSDFPYRWNPQSLRNW